MILKKSLWGKQVMNFRITQCLLIICLLFSLITAVHAAVPVAIIDSGTDLKHKDLINKAWTNSKDTLNNRDDDYDGLVDDIHGWNFAENDNKLVDYTLLGKFSPDCYKFFEIQLKAFKGTITEEEKNWIKSKRDDMKFLSELQVFGNFVHGTHVAGIVAKDSTAAQIMGIKLLPTNVKQPFKKMPKTDPSKPRIKVTKLIEKGIYFGLDKLAEAQGGMLEKIGLYVWFQKVKVANCSFGSSVHAVKPVLEMLLKKFLRFDVTDEQLTGYAKYMIQAVVDNGRQFAVDAKDTLFVIAAGNDGTNNDELPTYPANVKRNNTITVAATYGYSKLASFSNYGTKMVEIAAPGVGIKSSIPGDATLTVSGTSQASPFVANIAAQIIDTNPKLTFKQVKQILMGTVDKKDFLKDKVASGGIANIARAVKAAELSLTSTVDKAVELAIVMIADVQSSQYEPVAGDEKLILMNNSPVFEFRD